MKKSILWVIGLLFSVSFAFTSCDETDGAVDPYFNWKERNQFYIDSIARVAKANPSEWKIIHTYKFNPPINDLKFHFNCQYDEKDSIGKRYRRQDAIGTPYCITVDHQTLEDNCVTLRNRDTMAQERVAIADLNSIIADKVSITSLLKTLQ